MSHSGRASVGGVRWPVPVATLVAWGLVALSAGWWGLKMASGGEGVSIAAAPLGRSPEPVDPVAVGRLLGAQPAPAEGTGSLAAPSLASRFVLMGVVAGFPGGGAALLAVDGQPPKPYRVGSVVAEGLVLQSVRGRSASIGPARSGPAAVTLELPPLVP